MNGSKISVDELRGMMSRDLQPLMQSRQFQSTEISPLLFCREIGEFADFVQIVVVGDAMPLIATPEAGVRCHAVERIFHRHSEFTGSRQAYTITVGGQLSAFEDIQDPSFQVAAPDDIGKCVEWIATHIDNVAVSKIFAKFHTLEAIDLALNGAPTQSCREMRNDRFRCAKGLIAAKLVKRPNYDQLLDVYRERVQKWGQRAFEKYFAPLVLELDQM